MLQLSVPPRGQSVFTLPSKLLAGLADDIEPTVTLLSRSDEMDIVKWAETYFYIEERADPVTGENIGPGPIILAPFQRRVLRAALERDEKGKFKYATIVWSAPKKSGKTRIGAMVGAWAAATLGDYGEVYCVANTGEQSGDRILGAVKKAVEIGQKLAGEEAAEWVRKCKVTIDKVIFPNGSRVEALPVNASGAAGSNPTAVVYSELWGFGLAAKERMWTEMTISPARRGKSFRWVETYAGFSGESPTLERLYEAGYKHGKPHPDFDDLRNSDGEVCVRVNEASSLFCYWDTEPRMPWQTPEYYEEEATALTESEFLRIHRNQWVRPLESFVPINWWDQNLQELPPMQPGERLILGADAGWAHDSFALVGVTRNPKNNSEVAVRYVKVWYPQAGQRLDFDCPDGPDCNNGPRCVHSPNCEIRRLCKSYRVLEIAYDETQLHYMSTQHKRLRIANWQMFQQVRRYYADGQLYQLIRDGRIKHDGNTELRAHIEHANAKHKEDKGTHLMIVKGNRGAVDAAVALSMAADRCLYLRI